MKKFKNLNELLNDSGVEQLINDGSSISYPQFIMKVIIKEFNVHHDKNLITINESRKNQYYTPYLAFRFDIGCKYKGVILHHDTDRLKRLQELLPGKTLQNKTYWLTISEYKGPYDLMLIR